MLETYFRAAHTLHSDQPIIEIIEWLKMYKIFSFKFFNILFWCFTLNKVEIVVFSFIKLRLRQRLSYKPNQQRMKKKRRNRFREEMQGEGEMK